MRLKLKEILYVEALENYVSVITNDEKYTIHFTMRAIEQQLPSGPLCKDTPLVPCKQERHQVYQREQPDHIRRKHTPKSCPSENRTVTG